MPCTRCRRRIFATVSTTSIPALAPDHPGNHCEPRRQWGPVWTPITPPTGFLFHADPQLIVYPKTPRPSFADQVLALFRDHGLRPAVVHEMRELQTALGLVAAESGICLVPASVETLRRDNVAYRPIKEKAVSPVIMSTRKGDRSPEIALLLQLVKDIYRREGIAFGV
ncbi:LysR substrate-binding domain-containing protein [Roseomonas mucosa]|uniref:LysR substrate-binding domain-containing protein n=1 Tax=Roseomonas mucosa TaxID=207340 RepID=UPI001FD15807|nr:LysR substrate-binding domain-containing protein [Roseomonas mucosa]